MIFEHKHSIFVQKKKKRIPIFDTAQKPPVLIKLRINENNKLVLNFFFLVDFYLY